MSYTFARAVIRLTRTVAIALVLSLAVAYGVVGPARLHSTASQLMSKAASTVHGHIASSELGAIEEQIASDRRVVAAASTQRDALHVRVNKLIELRNDLISRKEVLRKSSDPVMQALHQSPGDDLVQVNGRAYRRTDIDLRMLSLEMQGVSIDQEIGETKRVIAQLVSEYGDLDHRIVQVKERLDSRERALLVARYRLEGQVAGTDALDRLDSLDR